MIDPPRILDLHDMAPEARLPRLRCSLAGCDERTRERKPFCTAHVDLHPHASKVLIELEVRRKEQALVRAGGWRAVDVAGSTARDLLLELRLRGKRTTPRLARDLVLPERVVGSYVTAFAKRGWVGISKTRRGVRLVCPKAIPSELCLADATAESVRQGGARDDGAARSLHSSSPRVMSDSAA